MNIVLCDVLCFVRNKFVNTNVKVLKSTLVDFYSVEDIIVCQETFAGRHLCHRNGGKVSTYTSTARWR